MPDQTLPTPRRERLSDVAAKVDKVVDDLSRLDAAVAMLEGEDYYRLDAGALMIRSLVEGLADQVDAMAAAR